VGSLHYHHVDVRQSENLRETVAKIARQKNRLDGLVAAAGVQQTKAAVDYTAEEVTQMMDINFTGVFMTATAVAKEMIALGSHGSIVLVASMSGLIANKGLICPVYNASKAAVMQLTRNLAMEWGPKGIRVNSLCPGHVITPMVESNLKEDPKLKETWEKENMLHRLGTPEEFTGAVIFMLSDASSYMTGSALVMDGGHTAW
jgi:NAD(P)-dependent dehydrogenase (short-subunit alcohol dehydrogenase family)